MRICYLCGQRNFKIRWGKVRDNPRLKVMECVSCGLVFLSSFSHIYEGFYESSEMHGGKLDVDEWLRETAKDDERRYQYFRHLIENKSILDFGCGNGGFLVRAKKVASRAVGIESEIRLKPYFLENGLRVVSSIDAIKDRFDIITLFHVLEHIADPVSLLRQLSKKVNRKGHIIIEVPNANDALISMYKSRAFSNFTYWSCHLFLFTAYTISLLTKKAGLKLNYVKQIQRYPLSNHLYWLSQNKPRGHKEWGFLDSVTLNKAYEKQLVSIGCCDTLIVSISKKKNDNA